MRVRPAITRSAAASGSFLVSADVAADVVAGAGRDDAERRVGRRQRLDREVDQPVAAADDQRVGAGGDALARQVERLVGVAALERVDLEARRLAAAAARAHASRAPRPLPDVGLVSSAISPQVADT